jgi:hypothetical protein
MQSTERQEFDKHVRVLCAGFNVPATDERLEAYWRGLLRMQIPQVVRVVDHAIGERGPEKLPTPKALWGILRNNRASAPAPSRASLPKPDQLHVVAQLSLFAFLLRKGGASDDSLRQLIATKNRIVEGLRASRSAGELASDETNELRDVLQNAFAKLWQPRSPEEIAADFEHFARTGHVRDSNQLI